MRIISLASNLFRRSNWRYLKRLLSAILNDPTVAYKTLANYTSHNIGKYIDPPKKILTSINELDQQFALVEAARRESDDRMMEILNSFCFCVNLKNLGLDPWSQEYKKAQLDLYCKLSNKEYYNSWESERSEFEVESAVVCPYPYSTRSPKALGNYLIAIGFILKTIELKTGASVLEYGMGWGHLTIELARLGYEVTSVDIEPRFVELVRRRAAQENLELTVFNGQFGEVPDASKKFDAIIFFESFHHCIDHVELIDRLWDIIHENGRIVFAGEPIFEGFSMPWGIRLDGLSVWSIRKHKWMELGFKESYFIKTLMRKGWSVFKHVCTDSPSGTTFIAKKNNGCIKPSEMFLPPDEDLTWAHPERERTQEHRATSSLSYLTLDENIKWKYVEIETVNYAPFDVYVLFKCDKISAKSYNSVGETVKTKLPLPVGNRLLEIKPSKTFNPFRLGIGKDNRDLGVAIRQIRYFES